MKSRKYAQSCADPPCPPTKEPALIRPQRPLPNRPQMPPFPDQSQANANLDLPPFTECSNNSPLPTCSIIFVFFLLVFYALALWDRWLNLKLRESQKLQSHTTPQFYGATQSSCVRLPAVTVTSAAPSTVAHPPKANDTPSQDSHLAPPLFSVNENPMLCVSSPRGN
ncbi:hypothetical protein B0H17DRAFT_60773 [Mycena rosella]|uniref:Uncharacterized protein n=1 Tax=Mycena rosella TaxID=1033263 RepID=A0AAD7GCA7_MYCRO|nr:hypothetical protein B0H17DRAFT_60773 [Mycena rosella]